jgi:hypothetical protein
MQHLGSQVDKTPEYISIHVSANMPPPSACMVNGIYHVVSINVKDDVMEEAHH